ncbi:MAG: nuclear transport factor 2 family protein [Sphingobacterium sp.]|uniref:nuclear transport factor 2 family protein n=1 Tax=Sphingobacterium sp. JB170 TaxID=1434842 RepID=UPI00097E9D52|nr:nuclear transport factor 2 family protein [Sphingobacterium sp. JB170]SJN23450.1 Cytochrome P-450:NADPH-P-450 reductase [Sphingobacterium sp. JB170]
MDNTITENNILEQENKLYSAMKEGNVPLLDELLHNDLLFILPSGEVITKEIDLDTYRDGTLKVDELLPKIESLNIIDDMAVITLTMKLKGKFNTVPFEADYRYIRFWKKFDKGIKVVGGSGIAI